MLTAGATDTLPFGEIAALRVCVAVTVTDGPLSGSSRINPNARTGNRLAKV